MTSNSVILTKNYDNLCLKGREVWVGRNGKDGRKNETKAILKVLSIL